MTFMGDPRFAQEAQLRRVADNIEASANQPAAGGEDHEAHAAGKTCEHCGRVLTETDDVRRTANGEWAHENCPPD
ncbi:MAG: hypothetical protein ACTHK4_01570 [Mycobacteriales bacterium]